LPKDGIKILLSRKRKPEKSIDQWLSAELYFAVMELLESTT